jgi:transposase
MGPFRYFVGIDWGGTSHQVCLLDSTRLGEAPEQAAFEHSGLGLSGIVQWLLERCQGRPDHVAVTIEITRSAVVDTLLEKGFSVFAVNPKQLDRFRDRHTAAGAKDDRRDAFVLADSLRTDPAAFRALSPEEPWLIRLRELTRIEEDLKDESRRLSNRLHGQLQRFYPQVLQLVPGADEPWLWRLLELAPTPAQAQRLTRSRVQRLLHESHIRRFSAEQILEQLKRPAVFVTTAAAEAAAEHISLILPRLQLAHDQLVQCQRRIQRLLDDVSQGQQREHRDVGILLSLPGAGRFVAATMLAEAWRPLTERDYHALRSHAGAAPVTRQSGKRKLVSMRRACNRRLQNAMFHWSLKAIRFDPRLRELYAAARQRGHGNARALRTVADRLLALLVTLLRTDQQYNPALRLPRPA